MFAIIFAVCILLFTAINELSCGVSMRLIIGCYYILVLMAAMASVLYGLVLTNDVMWDGTIERLVKLEYDTNARHDGDRKNSRQVTAAPASSRQFVRKHLTVLKHFRFKHAFKVLGVCADHKRMALLYSVPAAVSTGLVFAQNYGIIALPGRQEC
jgi:hypothetical protein